MLVFSVGTFFDFQCIYVQFTISRTKNIQTSTRQVKTQHINLQLAGGFNPIEKYESKWESSPGKGENNKYLKPPPSTSIWRPNEYSLGTCIDV